jgi:Flp pilus assembly pilin Flp
VEYALIITCVALLIVGALIAFGGSVAGLYDVDF